MPGLLFILIALFVGSGCAALIYEVVWLQLLQLLIGSSAVSLAVLLGTYMGGMCLGSWLLPLWLSPRQHPLRVYAGIELGIGLAGLIVLSGVPRLDHFYAAMGTTSIVFRCIIAALFLLVPTMLMGASLPAVARWVQTNGQGVAWLGYFYGGNIFGAVAGAVLAGFYLLRLYDMAVGTYVAVAINVAVGLAAWVLAGRTQHKPATDPPASVGRSLDVFVLVAIALSGFAALGAEVVWTRLLALMLGATVYTFSIILAVFLTGLGLGSAAASRLIRSHFRLALSVCQFVLVAAVAWAAFSITNIIPVPGFDPSLPTNPWMVFRMDLARCVWAILPSAILWGASFPLALGALTEDEFGAATTDTALLVGRTYAANTLGGILGALLCSVVIIPQWGTQNAERVLMAVCAISGCIVLWQAIPARQAVAGIASAWLVTWVLIFFVHPAPWVALAYGRLADRFRLVAGKPLYIGEGMNSTIVVSELDNGVRYFHVSGKVEATTETFDMRLQRMLGHMSALFHGNPKSVLVVGFGAGVTAGAFTLHPGIEKITIDELEPLVPAASTKYFARENYGVLHDPRTQIHYDDARHFVLTSKEKFDIITSDPIHPWVKGTSTLYSKEYFEMCKRHLKQGGLVTQWVPLYESDFATVKSELATFFSVFPHATIWNSDASNKGYDVVVVGQLEPGLIDVDALDERLHRPEYAAVVQSLSEVELGTAREILATYAGRDDELRQWLDDAQINRDLNMRLQYLAGWNVNFNRPDAIFLSMTARRTFPADLFVGSAGRLEELRRRLAGQVGH